MTFHFSCPAAARFAVVPLLAVIILCSSASHAAADLLYMGEGLFTPLSIWRMDSADPLGTFTALRDNTEDGSIRDIFLDAATGLRYWAPDPPLNTQLSAVIKFDAIDGTGATTIPVSTPLGQVHGIAVDSTPGIMFIATTRNLLAGAPIGIGWIPLTGGAYTPIFTHTSGSVGGIAIDPATAKLYAVLRLFNGSIPDNRIVRMNYDGTGLETLYTLANSDFLTDLEIDVPRNRLAFGLNSNIALGSLDGTASLAIVDPVRAVHSIALGANGQGAFFSDIADDSVHYIKFNGTDEAKLRTVFNVFALESRIPEPTSLSLLTLAACGLASRRRPPASATSPSPAKNC